MYPSGKENKSLTDSETWKVLFLGNYALNALTSIYNPHKTSFDSVATNRLCYDQRRITTVRKYLEQEGLIEVEYNKQDCSLIPIEKEVEKILKGFMKEPVFNTSGFIEKKEHSWSSKSIIPVVDLGDVYVDIDTLPADEVIHLYVNRKEYDFQLIKTTNIYHPNNRSGRCTTKEYIKYSVKAYPLSELDSSSEVSITASSKAFAKEHAREILSATFDLSFRQLSDTKEYMTYEAISKRLTQVEDKLRLLGRTRKELLVLQRKASKLGDEALKKNLLDTSLQYIRRSAPLWINSKDKDKKEISTLVCKGAQVQSEHVISR